MEGTTDFFLKQRTALRLLYERAEPLLFATKFIRPVYDDKAAFTYRYDDTGKSADAKKKKPAHAMIGGDFPEVDISRAKTGTNMTESRGFQVRIKRELIRDQPVGVNEIQKAYEFAGFWMAQWINDDILAAIKAGATVPTWAPGAGVWSGAAATPFEDLRTFKNKMKREGYAYRMTDAIIANENFEELEGYLAGIDVNEFKSKMIYGVPTLNEDTINIPLVGDVTGVLSGMTEGTILGLDRNNPCAELHYYVDSKFATKQVSYNTIVGGKQTMVKADNIGFHFDQWEEQSSKDTILRFWVEEKVVVTEPYAALYDNGI